MHAVILSYPGFDKTGAVFTTLHFFRNLQMCSISWCFITLSWKWLPGTNTELIGTIDKLKRKLSVVNMGPGSEFTTLFFLCNL